MMKIKRDSKYVVLTGFGKSMYGGWYCNYRVQDEAGNVDKFDGYHASTLRELCTQAGVSRTALERDVPRFDN